MFTLPDAILVPVFGHLALVFYLFVMVSIKRMKAVGEGQILTDDLAHKSNEPEASRRWVCKSRFYIFSWAHTSYMGSGIR